MAMKVVVNLDVVLAQRKRTIAELSDQIKVSMTELNTFKYNKAREVSIQMLALICEALECQPGDLMEVMDEEAYRKLFRLDKKTEAASSEK